MGAPLMNQQVYQIPVTAQPINYQFVEHPEKDIEGHSQPVMMYPPSVESSSTGSIPKAASMMA